VAVKIYLLIKVGYGLIDRSDNNFRLTKKKYEFDKQEKLDIFY